MKEVIFQGSGVALVTPFDSDWNINWDELERLIEFQLSNETDCIIACGTTGEAATMTTEEHLQVIDFIVKKVAGRVPVIAGTGSNDTKFSVELSLEAKKLGVQGLLLVTPYYNKTSQKGLVESFSYIANSVEMPCVLYNVPSRTGCNIIPETYLELSKNPYIVAVKEANGNTAAAAKTISLCGSDLMIYSGEDNQTLPMMALGGIGVISVFANACPREMHELTHAMLDGDLDMARRINSEYIDLMNGFFLDVNPIPIKEALNIMGYKCGGCRMPLTGISDGDRQKLVALLKKHRLI